jgi:hypothetical protein
MPLSAPYIAKQLVRVIPSSAQFTFVGQLNAAATSTRGFDIARAVTDENQLLVGAAPAGTNQHAIGPLLDAFGFSDQVGRIDVDYAVDNGATYRNTFTIGIAAGIPTNISGLRITGRFVRVTLTNTAGVAANVEFGIWVRSS